MEKLFIIIPAYNEQDNIEQLINDWYPVIDKCSSESKIVVIDDGSKDNTYNKLLSLAQIFPKLIPLTKPNGGHGPTLIYGYNYALANGADYVFQTDSDGQTNPDEFEKFWQNRRNFSAIIGNRVVRGDGKSRKFVENTVCFLLRMYFGVKVKDANAPFRLMRADVLKKYLNKIQDNYNLPNIMLTTYFVYYKEKVKFEEISFKPRQAGTNSINIKKICKIGWKALGDFYSFKKDMKIK